jgi:hypothetical protein
MTPREVLSRLETEGVSVSLSLKVKADAKPSDEAVALVMQHKGALLEHLARERGGLDLAPVLIHSLLVWIARYHPLNVTTPQGTQLDATPEQALDALQASAWCVIADGEGYRLISRGNVPPEVRAALRELDSGSCPAQGRTEQQAAVVN